MMLHERLLVLGNTGSGKSTLARGLVERCGGQHLDLDTVVFDPERIAQMRSPRAIEARLDAWRAKHPRWVVEGSYADWAAYLSPVAQVLVFLNPGVERCLDHQRRRPWEPHKYDDPAEQERRRAFLEDWTRRYPDRDDQFGLAAHRAVFDRFEGVRIEVGAEHDPVQAVLNVLDAS